MGEMRRMAGHFPSISSIFNKLRCFSIDFTSVIVMCMYRNEEGQCAESPSTHRVYLEVTTEEGTSIRSRTPLAQAAQPQHSFELWKRGKDPDTAPAISRFQPCQTQGLQLNTLFLRLPRDRFLLFFATDTVRTTCINTNKNAAKNKELGKKYKWADTEAGELYKFSGLPQVFRATGNRTTSCMCSFQLKWLDPFSGTSTSVIPTKTIQMIRSNEQCSTTSCSESSLFIMTSTVPARFTVLCLALVTPST